MSIDVFTVDPAEVDALPDAPLDAWEDDANWMKRQPGYVLTQLHRGIGGSGVFLNYALWESEERFAQGFTHPDLVSALARNPASAVAQPHLFSRVAVPNPCTA